MFTLLRGRNNFFELINLILKNNPALIDASPLSSNLMTHIDRLEKAYAIQFDCTWFKKNEQLSASIKQSQSQFSLHSQSIFKNTANTLMPSQAQEINIQLKPDELSVVTNYINRLLTMFNPLNVKNMLRHKNADTYLLTPTLRESKKSETLFEIILDNPQYLQIFNFVLQSDKFLATGRVISDLNPINDIIKRILTPDLTDLNHINLFDILISNQPGLTLAIATKFITPTLFYRLSSSESGRHALDKMITNFPEFFRGIIDRIATINNENQEDWIGELLISKAGCAIISKLYDLNEKILNCVAVHKLARRASQDNKNQTPLYFWLSATHHFMTQPDFIKEFDPSILLESTNQYFYQLCTQDGKKILSSILHQHPQFATLITKDLFYKCTQALSNRSVFLTLLPRPDCLQPEEIFFIYKILKENPGLINLSSDKFENIGP